MIPAHLLSYLFLLIIIKRVADSRQQGLKHHPDEQRLGHSDGGDGALVDIMLTILVEEMTDNAFKN